MVFNKYFNLRSDSAEVAQLFATLNTVKQPYLDEDDIERDLYTDWVLVKRKGVELGFSNQAWQQGKPRLAWRSDNLVLSQIYFYTQNDNTQAYTGKLPYELLSTDTRAQVRDKLKAFEATRKSYITDCWDVDENLYLTVRYNNYGAIASVFLRLKIQALKPTEHTLTLADLSSSFNKRVSRQTVKDIALFNKLTLPLTDEQWDEWYDTRELTLTDEYGIELYLDNSKSATLSAIKFFAPRERESVGWSGDMPLGLTFDDSPEVLLAKVKKQPNQRSDETLTGFCLWHFETFSLHVVYSNVDNRLLRVTVMAVGYWQD